MAGENEVRGRDVVVAFYEETTYGADPATPDGLKLPVSSFSVRGSQNLLDTNRITGSRTRPKPILGNVDVEGQFVAEIGHEKIHGLLLKHLFGSVSTTGVGPYTHSFSIGAQPVGFQLEVDYGSVIVGSGRVERFRGCKMARLELEASPEGYLVGTWSVRGRERVLAASALDATITDTGHTPFTMAQVPATGGIQEGGADIAYVRSVRLQIQRELEENKYVIGGGGLRRKLPETLVSVTGTLTALFESAALLSKAVNSTNTSLKLAFKRGSGDGSAGNEYLEFNVPNMILEPTSPEIQGPQGIEVEFNFRAFLSGSTEGVTATLKNQVTSL